MDTEPHQLSGAPFPFDSLIDFLVELRNDGWNIGTQEVLGIQRLVALLAERGELGDEPEELGRYLRPLLCTSSVQQEEFGERFGRWVERVRALRQARATEAAAATEPDLRERIGMAARALRALKIATWPLLVVGCLGVVLWVALPMEAIGATLLALLAEFFSPDVVPQGGDASNGDHNSTNWEGLVFAAFAVGGLLCGGLLTFLLAAAALWRLRAARFLVREPSDVQFSVQRLHVSVAVNPFASEILRRAAHRLRLHRRVQTSRVDPRATAQQSARGGGWYQPVLGRRARVPEYLVLVDRVSSRDHQARLAGCLLDQLDREGVLVERYDFRGMPRICERRGSPPVTIEALASRLPSHDVWLISDGQELVDEYTGALAPGLARLDVWASRVLFTPVPRASWGLREEALQDAGWQVLPLSVGGIAELVELRGSLADGGALATHGDLPQSLRASWAPWLEPTAPADARVEQLIRELKTYLGPAAFGWLCACAVYPEIRWEMTVALGTGRDGEEATACSPRTLASLCRLPWFRIGRMPDWLRRRLMLEMGSRQERKVREHLRRVLLASLDPDAKGGSLEVSAADATAFRRMWTVLSRRLARSSAPDNPMRDRVFARWMGERLSVRLPRQVAKLLFRVRSSRDASAVVPSLKPAVALARGLVGGVAVALIAVALAPAVGRVFEVGSATVGLLVLLFVLLPVPVGLAWSTQARPRPWIWAALEAAAHVCAAWPVVILAELPYGEPGDVVLRQFAALTGAGIALAAWNLLGSPAVCALSRRVIRGGWRGAPHAEAVARFTVGLLPEAGRSTVTVIEGGEVRRPKPQDADRELIGAAAVSTAAGGVSLALGIERSWPLLLGVVVLYSIALIQRNAWNPKVVTHWPKSRWVVRCGLQPVVVWFPAAWIVLGWVTATQAYAPTGPSFDDVLISYFLILLLLAMLGPQFIVVPYFGVNSAVVGLFRGSRASVHRSSLGRLGLWLDGWLPDRILDRFEAASTENDKLPHPPVWKRLLALATVACVLQAVPLTAGQADIRAVSGLLLGICSFPLSLALAVRPFPSTRRVEIPIRVLEIGVLSGGWLIWCWLASPHVVQLSSLETGAQSVFWTLLGLGGTALVIAVTGSVLFDRARREGGFLAWAGAPLWWFADHALPDRWLVPRSSPARSPAHSRTGVPLLLTTSLAFVAGFLCSLPLNNGTLLALLGGDGRESVVIYGAVVIFAVTVGVAQSRDPIAPRFGALMRVLVFCLGLLLAANLIMDSVDSPTSLAGWLGDVASSGLNRVLLYGMGLLAGSIVLATVHACDGLLRGGGLLSIFTNHVARIASWITLGAPLAWCLSHWRRLSFNARTHPAVWFVQMAVLGLAAAGGLWLVDWIPLPVGQSRYVWVEWAEPVAREMARALWFLVALAVISGVPFAPRSRPDWRAWVVRFPASMLFSIFVAWVAWPGGLIHAIAVSGEWRQAVASLAVAALAYVVVLSVGTIRGLSHTVLAAREPT